MTTEPGPPKPKKTLGGTTLLYLLYCLGVAGWFGYETRRGGRVLDIFSGRSVHTGAPAEQHK
jgi:hypothetical protein